MALDCARFVNPAKKLVKFFRKIDRDPSPEQVHGLRTNVRRFEASFKALALDEEGLDKSIVKQLNRLRKRAGKVRDMDVLTAFATKVHPQGEDECHVRLLEHLGSRRKKYAVKLHDEAKHLRPEMHKTLKKTRSMIAKLLRQNVTDPGNSIVANAAASAVRLSSQLALPGRLTRKNLHPYRLKVKELRNILRLADSPSRPRFVDDLRKVKDAIGEWHDWEELAKVASEELNHGRNCRLTVEIRQMAESKYKHALSVAVTLRKTYLKSSRWHSHNKRAVASAIPRTPVWEATARLVV